MNQRREYHQNWYAENKDRLKVLQAEWYSKNKEQLRARRKAWREANREKIKERMRLRYVENRDMLLAQSANWQRNNKDRKRANNKAWAEANRHRVVLKARKHQIAKINACPKWAEQEIIELVYAEAARRGMEVDHIIPLQGKLVCGLHVHTNMQLLTKSANSSKGNRFSPIFE